MSDSAGGEQRRAYFRLPYPSNERPVLHCGGSQHEVVEIAEGGIRLILEPGIPLTLNESVAGEIAFHDEQREAVIGKVLRLEGKNVVVQLVSGLTQHRVMAEQSYLHQKYPDFLRRNR
ncbi:PilZ domain-containing protein [Litorivivens sp.]|uniref:PilZ domain-containing protein n=1 Tax=Litorivivens sp. TaxID=2020868 RepID=UPI0035668453